MEGTMNHFLIIGILAMGLMSTSCSTPQGPNQAGGTMIGGVSGALLGAAIGGSGTSAVVGAGLGAVAGGFAGNQIGASMDRQKAPRGY
jgi:uncharacterized protein YcfJ